MNALQEIAAVTTPFLILAFWWIIRTWVIDVRSSHEKLETRVNELEKQVAFMKGREEQR